MYVMYMYSVLCTYVAGMDDRKALHPLSSPVNSIDDPFYRYISYVLVQNFTYIYHTRVLCLPPPPSAARTTRSRSPAGLLLCMYYYICTFNTCERFLLS